MIITGLYRKFLFFLCHLHPGFDSLINTGRISQNQRGSRICLCLCNGADTLIIIGAHGNLRHIDITITHGNRRQVFLFDLFSSCRKLSNRSKRRGFRGLPSGIGINFRIKHKNINVSAACQHMIQTAKSNIIGPAVTAKNPFGFFGKELFLFQNFF